MKYQISENTNNSIFSANLVIQKKVLSLYQSVEVPDDNDIAQYNEKIVVAGKLGVAGMKAALGKDVDFLKDAYNKVGILEEELDKMKSLILKEYNISEDEIYKILISRKQDLTWMDSIIQSSNP